MRSGGAIALPLEVSLVVSGGANASDYERLPAAVTIPAGAVSVPLSVLPRRDNLLEHAVTYLFLDHQP